MEQYRSLLQNYAYHICGSMEEAKDIVQDVYMRYIDVDVDDVINEKSYLIKMVVNRAINYKRKQQKLDYPGEWLPEPIATEKADESIQKAEILNYSLMVLIELLNPKQRAVFILKEAYDYDHAEIATILEITVAHSRQLLSRAKKSLDENNSIDPAGHMSHQIIEEYMQAIQSGNVKQLEKLLHQDILLVSDGGGKATAALKPLQGAPTVCNFLMGINKKFYSNTPIDKGHVNNQPALFYYRGGKLVTCLVFSGVKNSIHRLFIIRNPDKLLSLRKNTKKGVTF